MLSARVLESCVVVRCAGFASAAECEAFAAELEAAGAVASAWRPPETQQQKRKRKPQTQGV